jgi:RiboL-PSP-HEPN
MQKALANLKSSLNRVLDIVVDIDAHAQDALKDPAIQARHETTLCAATVILSGFLESFLRELAEEVINDICNRAIPFDTLPPKVRITHYWEGALQLRETARQEKSQNPVALTEALNIAKRLASVGTIQLPYELIWEAFAETRANPGPDQIGDFLRRFEIADPLPTLAAAMKTTPNTLVISLDSFMKVRHECAHTGSAKIMPTTTDVTAYCALIERLGTGMVDVFQDILGKPPYVAAAPPAPTPVGP